MQLQHNMHKLQQLRFAESMQLKIVPGCGKIARFLVSLKFLAQQVLDVRFYYKLISYFILQNSLTSLLTKQPVEECFSFYWF